MILNKEYQYGKGQRRNIERDFDPSVPGGRTYVRDGKGRALPAIGACDLPVLHMKPKGSEHE